MRADANRIHRMGCKTMRRRVADAIQWVRCLGAAAANLLLMVVPLALVGGVRWRRR